MRINQKVRNAANEAIQPYNSGSPFHSIPLGPIFDALRDRVALIVVQEDGEPWSGILCGREGRVSFDLKWGEEIVSNASLELSWYRFETGRYEVITYVS